MVICSRRVRFSNALAFCLGVFLCYSSLRAWRELTDNGFTMKNSPQWLLNRLWQLYCSEKHDHLVNHSRQPKTIEDSTVADMLTSSIRVLCLVLTTSSYHSKRAIHVKETWGQRCTKLVFISDVEDAELGAIATIHNASYNELWGKVRNMFKRVYADQQLSHYDWYLKCDDDTYVIMENLRLTLSSYSPNDPLLIGRKFNYKTSPGAYMSGGAGYVLSRKAVEKFATEALAKPLACRTHTDTGSEDIEMARCLYGVNVRFLDILDSMGRQLFFPFAPAMHLREDYCSNTHRFRWLCERDFHTVQLGQDCCGPTAITFHYIEGNEMYAFEYLIYMLKPFGISLNHDVGLAKAKLTENGYTFSKIY